MRTLFLANLWCVLAICAFAQPEHQKSFQRQFIEVDDNSVLELPAGTFHLQGLWMDSKNNVVIRGAGSDKTFLEFSGQTTGAEGVKITNCKSITLEEVTVRNTKGDGVKAQLVEGLTLRNITVEWTKGADKKNGGYGLYPVQCTNVLIDKCTARGASDAGIYVGQSKQIVVKNSTAFENVAGIEIENSLHADVFDNDVYNNTGGILVFDLPDLILKRGGWVRVFRNNVRDNNHNNFAPKGNVVGKVPPGTGVMILASRHVEVFDNRIVNNITAGTAIISYHMTENPINDPEYDPFPTDVYIHDNYFERPKVRATGQGRMGKLYRFKLRFGRDVPHIVYDGIEDSKRPHRNICIRNNGHATFADIDADRGFRNIARDLSPYDCASPSLSPVVLSNRVE